MSTDSPTRHATPSMSVPAAVKNHVKEPGWKELHSSYSEHAPAIKDSKRYRSRLGPAIKPLTGSRSKTVATPKVKSHSIAKTTGSSASASTKSPNTDRTTDTLGVPKATDRGAQSRNPADAPNGLGEGKKARSGRQDPYDIPSDSEANDAPRWKPMSTAPNHGSHLRKTRASNMTPSTPRNTLSTPTNTSSKPLAPIGTPNEDPIPSNQYYSRPHAQRRVPTSTQITPRNDSPGSNRKVSIPIASPDVRVSPRDPSARIPPGVEIISLIGESESDRESVQVSTPIRPSAKAIGKRSSHSVNRHLNTVDKSQDSTRTLPSPTSIKLKADLSRCGPRIEGRKVKINVDGDTETIAGLRETSQASFDDSVVASRKKRKDHGKPETERQHRKISQTRYTPSQPQTSNGYGDLKQEPQSNQGKPREIKSPGECLKIPSSFETATNDKTTKVRSKSREHKSIKPNLEKSNDSKDEYIPPSDDKQSSSNTDNELTSRVRNPSHVVEDVQASQPSSNRTLRSGSYPRPTTSFTPINKPAPKAAERTSVTESPDSHRSRRNVHDAFPDASGLRKSEDENQKDLINNSDSEDPDITQSTKSSKNRKWTPYSWMEKYEVTFQVINGRSIIFNGPFKGWILEGPGKEGYLAGYKAPSDKRLVRAEKSATLRNKSAHTDLEDGWSSDVEEPHDDGFDEADEVNTNQSTSDSHRDAVTSDTLKRLTDSSREQGSNRTAMLPCGSSPSASQAPRSITKCRTVGHVERTKRAKSSTGIPNPTARKANGWLPVNHATTTMSGENSRASSSVSESTSMLIEQQLLDDCVPPSNQELAELMSSSPSKQPAQGSSLIVPAINEPADPNDNRPVSSSSETSTDIPARLPLGTPPQPVAAPRNQDMSPRLESPSAMYIKNGIAERRTTRSLASRSPLISNPKPRLRSSGRFSTNDKPESADLTKTHIMVELPILTAEKQAEYKVISPTQETDSCSSSTLPPKSFKEINEATSTVNVTSNSSDTEENLNYVLRESPNWLDGITEIGRVDDASTNDTKPSFNTSNRDNRLAKSLDTAKPVAPIPKDEEPNVSRLTSAEDPGIRSKSTDRVDEQPLRGIGGKRNASTSVSMDESPVSKKQKILESQSVGIKTKRNRNRRQRKRQARLRQQNNPAKPQ